LKRIVVVGDVVTDIVVRPHGPVVHGTDTASSITITGGGSGANTAAWIGSLGGSCDFLGSVGVDQATWHESQLSAVGVRALLAVDAVLPTARIVVLVDPSGERTMLTDRGANDTLRVDHFLRLGLDIGRNSIVHVSGYTLLFDGPRDAGLYALEIAHSCGAVTSVDPNSSGFLAIAGPEKFLAMTLGVDLCFPNTDEVFALTGIGDAVQGACELTSFYPTVVCKLGAEGALVAQRGKVVARGDALVVDVVDSTGAGDAFAAGYLAGLAHDLEVSECLDMALATAAEAVARVGARPSTEMRPARLSR
jgi:sugar/nucleoside kinase (ribokinase family)